MFPEIDSIILSAGHSMIMGHKPKSITPEMINKKMSTEAQGLEKFGLFDNATPNYANYYPEVTAEDLQPKDEDFIYPLFRLLSETTVHKNHNPISFSKPGVLKKAMGMLLGQTINIDHETALGNAIGSVSEVFWQDGYKTKDGHQVPGGINGTFKIDGKSNPRIARGILMNPPSIHSNSVTVQFAWEQSHPKMDREDFFSKLGEYDEKGNQYARVVTEIKAFHETSLVAHGADPYAQAIGADGKIVNPSYADKVYSMSRDGKEFNQTKFFMYDFKDTVKNSAIPNNQLNTNSDNKNDIKMKKEQLEALSTKLGLAEGKTLTEENFFEIVSGQVESLQNKASDLEKEKSTLATEKEGLTTKVTELEGKVQTLETEKTDLTGKANEALEVKKAEVVKLYKLLKDEASQKESFIKSIEEGELEFVNDQLEELQSDVNEKFPLTCQKCSSTEVERKSTSQEEEEEDELSWEDSLRKKKRKGYKSVADQNS